MEYCYLRIHCPYCEYCRVTSKNFHDCWNELVFAYRGDDLRFEHNVNERFYEPCENDLYVYVEQINYVIWKDNTPYQFGYIQIVSEDKYSSDELDSNIDIVD